MALGICEILWLKKLLNELHVTIKSLVKLYCDKKTAINISLILIQHDRIKHVEVVRHFIKKNENGTTCITYVTTKEQTVDIFNLHQPNFNDFICKLNMINNYIQLEGNVEILIN